MGEPRLCRGGSRGLTFARIVTGILGNHGFRSEPQAGAEARRHFLRAVSARLKPCPFYKTLLRWFFRSLFSRRGGAALEASLRG